MDPLPWGELINDLGVPTVAIVVLAWVAWNKDRELSRARAEQREDAVENTKALSASAEALRALSEEVRDLRRGNGRA